MDNLESNDVDLFLRRALVVVLVVLVAGGVALFVYAKYFDSRLDTFEKHLRFQSPSDESDESPSTASVDQSPSSDNPLRGQTIYVPAYSHVYHQDGDPHLLTVTLSVRNTSIDHGIAIQSVRYFDTKGNEVKSHLAKPLRLGPLATAEFLVKRSDTSGGSGANFLVEWSSSENVTNPIVESVMIDTSADQGISFVRSGTVIKEFSQATP